MPHTEVTVRPRFPTAELGSAGTAINVNDHLILKGIFQQNHIENVLDVSPKYVLDVLLLEASLENELVVALDGLARCAQIGCQESILLYLPGTPSGKRYRFTSAACVSPPLEIRTTAVNKLLTIELNRKFINEHTSNNYTGPNRV